ncbi:hypothetical protein ACU8KI_28365 (plasmid) [Rhizobium leguminosarum]
MQNFRLSISHETIPMPLCKQRERGRVQEARQILKFILFGSDAQDRWADQPFVVKGIAI